MLRFYGPINPMEPCRAPSVYLTTPLLGRLSPLSGYQVLCTFFRQKCWRRTDYLADLLPFPPRERTFALLHAEAPVERGSTL